MNMPIFFFFWLKKIKGTGGWEVIPPGLAIQLFKEYLLNNYYVPETILGVWNKTVNKVNKNLDLIGFTF